MVVLRNREPLWYRTGFYRNPIFKIQVRKTNTKVILKSADGATAGGCVRGWSEYWTFSVPIGPSHNKRAVTSPPVDFFAIGLRIRNPRGKPVLKTF